MSERFEDLLGDLPENEQNVNSYIGWLQFEVESGNASMSDVGLLNFFVERMGVGTKPERIADYLVALLSASDESLTACPLGARKIKAATDYAMNNMPDSVLHRWLVVLNAADAKLAQRISGIVHSAKTRDKLEEMRRVIEEETNKSGK